MTHTLAMEWAPHGIRVNSISPGFVRTQMTAKIEAAPDFQTKMKVSPDRSSVISIALDCKTGTRKESELILFISTTGVCRDWLCRRSWAELMFTC